MTKDGEQKAQDMLAAVAAQREAALNHCVHLSAALVAAERKISELEAKLAPEASEIAKAA